jgi:hypothetical protein
MDRLQCGLEPIGQMTENVPVEALAEAIHRDYIRRCEKEGIKVDDDSLAAWGDLSETLKASNRSQAADIHRKLTAAGYEVIRAPNKNVLAMHFDDQEVELLAQAEHERWVNERLADGWRLGEARDVEEKRSPYLVPWTYLSEDIRDLDRDTVRRIPIFLSDAGFSILRHRRSK